MGRENAHKDAHDCALAIPAHRIVPTGSADALIKGMVSDLVKLAESKDPEKVKGRFMQDLEAVRASLEGPTPTPLERLLVERVVVTYAAIVTLECRSDHIPTRSTGEAARRMERLYRRFNEAAKALATVQRMRLPSSSVFVSLPMSNAPWKPTSEARRIVMSL